GVNRGGREQELLLAGVQRVQAGAQIFFTPNQQPFPLGVSLQVQPVVSADRRFVRINLQPTLTNLASTNVPLIPVQIPVPQLFEGPGSGTTSLGQPVIFQMFFQQPTLTQISLNTTVTIPDGGTVLLGGLKTLSEGRNEAGPPILSKIPYVNRLFKNVAYGRESQSLLIMVTPRIIINEEEELRQTGLAGGVEPEGQETQDGNCKLQIGDPICNLQFAMIVPPVIPPPPIARESGPTPAAGARSGGRPRCPGRFALPG